jgi:hypothetical protein
MDSNNSRNRKALLKQAGTTFPEVVNSPKSLRHRINDVLRKTAYSAVPDYSPETAVIEAWSDYKTTLNQNGILSIRFENYFYPEMAAHGVTGVSTVTLELDSGYIYDFYQLFRRGANYQAVIDGIIRNQIVTQQITLLKPLAAAGPNENYYLTSDSLVIYYPPYVYTAGAYGVLEFPISYQQIMEIIDPQGPIGRILMVYA